MSMYARQKLQHQNTSHPCMSYFYTWSLNTYAYVKDCPSPKINTKVCSLTESQSDCTKCCIFLAESLSTLSVPLKRSPLLVKVFFKYIPLLCFSVYRKIRTIYKWLLVQQLNNRLYTHVYIYKFTHKLSNGK